MLSLPPVKDIAALGVEAGCIVFAAAGDLGWCAADVVPLLAAQSPCPGSTGLQQQQCSWPLRHCRLQRTKLHDGGDRSLVAATARVQGTKLRGS
jgi:hypothetical protein